ncbi:23S rRNA-associated protein [sediment metagenome]|uniref:23S rRNA-associated protein n=1 Tax=sediment metagenome TaxID=749907 RepID=D9PIF4_9ZZZZ
MNTERLNESMIKDFKDLEVWQRGIELVKNVYTSSQRFPKEEMYGLVNQMRRAAISVVSNIAEGKARQTKNEYIQFLHIALGSAAELETQVIVSNKLGYMENNCIQMLLEEINHVTRMIRKLIRSLRSNSPNSLSVNRKSYTVHREPLTVNRTPYTVNRTP